MTEAKIADLLKEDAAAADEAADKVKRLQQTYDDLAGTFSTIGSLASSVGDSLSMFEDNEIERITQAEDNKIKVIEDRYDQQLALEEKGSDAYEQLQKDKTEEVKIAEDAKYELIRKAKEKQWKMDHAFAIGESIINTLVSVTSALANPILAGAIAAAGALATGAIISQPMPAFAKGTDDYVTSGPEAILVGDNPGGRERVTVEPLSSSNINGPQTGGTRIIINLEGKVLADFTTAACRNGDIQVYEGSIVN